MDSQAFGAQALRTRLGAFTQEIEGVRAGTDRESIHRMRVAGRRLRTALTHFPALSKAKWNKQIKKLAQTLGAARDTDVQIEFLQQAIVRAPERRFRPGLQRLLLRLTQQRADQQTHVVEALDKFEKADLSGELLEALTTADSFPDGRPEAAGADSPSSEGTVSQIGVGTPIVGQEAGAVAEGAADLVVDAHQAIATLIQEVLAFDQAVHDPAHITELHQLRIACKHLRYTLEIFVPLYEERPARFVKPQGSESPTEAGLQPYLTIVKTFQEILGDIHDCDVWVDALPQFLDAERARTQDYFGHDRPLKSLEPGVAYLQQERQYHRAMRYNEFLDLWIAQREADTWGNLRRLSLMPASPAALIPPDSTCIALLGDIHANLPALEAVLDHAHKHGATAIWNVGDFVGYGPYPDEVIQRLQVEGAVSISGNYDVKVLQVKDKKEKWKKTKRPEKLLAFEWAYDHLSKGSLAYLGSLPAEKRLAHQGRRILLAHGSPESNEEGLTAGTPLKRLRELAQGAGADLIIIGHSHQPFAKQVDNVWFINTGSVGRPDDGDPRACYALLKITPDSVQVKHYRVKYDTQKIAAAVREAGLPESFARIFLHGRSLDDLVVEE